MLPIILIEPHDFMRQALASRLRLMGFEPNVCQNMEQAWPALEALEHGFVISALELGDLSGLDLLWWLRQRRKGAMMLLLTEEPDAELAQALRPRGCLLSQPHPAHLAEVFKRLNDSEYQLRFQLDFVTLYDLVQLLSQSQISTHFYVADPETGAEGLLFFEKGRILHAVYDTYTGEEAFFRIMGLNQGLFMETDFGRPEYYTIASETPHLMARSALQQDESLLAPVKILIVDDGPELADLLERNFPAQRLQVIQMAPGQALPAQAAEAALMVVAVEAMGASLVSALRTYQQDYPGKILLLGQQVQPGIAEALRQERVEHFFLRQLQLQEFLTFVQHRCFSQRFSGMLNHLSLFDCLQIFGRSPVPIRIQCADALSGEKGELLLGQGQIWFASLGKLNDRAALAGMLQITAGLITVSEAERQPDVSRAEPLTRIMMDLAVLRDQQLLLPENLLLSDGRILQPAPEKL
ncbi:MAG TPA: DUF4388 domain-containing protein [Candidatus Obscuribacterales bacterium]